MIGLILSLVMIRSGLVIQLEWCFLLIVLVSFIVSKINTRLTCLAYVMAIIFFIDCLLIIIGLKETLFKLDYVKMIYIVGILHFIEGIFTFLWGGEDSCPIITYRGKKVAGGYEASGSWLIPLLFFSVGGIYVPLIASVVYYNQSFVKSPREKAKTMGFLIGGYGIIICSIGYLVTEGLMTLPLGLLSMPLLHEFLFMIDDYIESRPLKYSLPTKGIRVMEVMGINALGITRGDIIKEINHKEIHDELEYCEALKSAKKFILKIEKIKGEEVQIICSSEELEKSKFLFLPPD
ncbi:MAG: hypothetical protein J6F30_02885 [Cellulosilyticum sp.]|nr:hypothetical protein [Cellulosilyticum sp.]